MTKAASRAHVLVVDDEIPIVRVLGRHLSNDGYTVASASDAPGAFAAIDLHPPDLILVDAWLGSVSGVELCRQFRAHRSTACVPVIMLTGMDNEGLRQAAKDAGVTAFVAKPYDSEELRTLVRSLLE